MPINPLGLWSHFVISSSLSATRNNILSTDCVPLKSPVRNFTALCTVQSLLALLHSLPNSHSAALPLFSLVFLRLPHELFPALHKYLPIPFSHHRISTMGYNIRGGRNTNLNKLDMIFITVSQPIPVAARSTAWVCNRSLVGIAVSNPAGKMDVCLCDYYVFSRRGPCVGLITRPEETYLLCECVSL